MMGLTFPTTGHRQTGALPATDPWADLDCELNQWIRLGRRATFWWRDDDAVSSTPALVRLLDLARAQGVRVALAVIPAKAVPDLFALLAQRPEAVVVQHGYAHANHAPRDRKKAELGSDRPAGSVLDELALGKALLDRATGGRALPVLVPPWNRIDARVAGGLARIGLRGLSTSKPRRAARDATGLAHANIHVDPIDWAALRAGAGGFAGESAALGAVVRHLADRRLGRADAEEPTGLLTHHLVMDEATWRFVRRFVETTCTHRGAAWLAPDRVFGRAP